MDFHVRDVEIIQDSVNINGITQEIKYILEKYSLKNEYQISLQSHRKNSDPRKEWKIATGSYKNFPGGLKEEDFIYPLFKEETSIINHYIKKWNMYRTRIMILEPRKVMTVHKDGTPRIHIPISTNEGCRMMIGTQCYHLEVGNIYWTNTTIEHTAFNGGNEPRIHIVGCVPDSVSTLRRAQ